MYMNIKNKALLLPLRPEVLWPMLQTHTTAVPSKDWAIAEGTLFTAPWTAVPEESRVHTGTTLPAGTVSTFESEGEKSPLDFSKGFYKHIKLKARPLSVPMKLWLHQKGIFKHSLPKREIFPACTHDFFQKGNGQEANLFPSVNQLAFNLKMTNPPGICYWHWNCNHPLKTNKSCSPKEPWKKLEWYWTASHHTIHFPVPLTVRLHYFVHHRFLITS